MENDCRRLSARHVVDRRNLFRRNACSCGNIIQLFLIQLDTVQRRQQDGWIEQYHRVGNTADGAVLVLLIQPRDNTAACCQMPTGGATARDDAIGIDAQTPGVGARPANGGLRVSETAIGQRFMPATHPIIGRDCDHPAGGEVAAVLLELSRITRFPATAKEENDGGPLIGCMVPGRLKDPKFQINIADRLVNLFPCVGELRRILFRLSCDEANGRSEQQRKKQQSKKRVRQPIQGILPLFLTTSFGDAFMRSLSGSRRCWCRQSYFVNDRARPLELERICLLPLGGVGEIADLKIVEPYRILGWFVRNGECDRQQCRRRQRLQLHLTAQIPVAAACEPMQAIGLLLASHDNQSQGRSCGPFDIPKNLARIHSVIWFLARTCSWPWLTIMVIRAGPIAKPICTVWSKAGSKLISKATAWPAFSFKFL